MKRRCRWIFWTICWVMLICELAAAGFFLYQAPIPVRPVRLDHEEIACVRMQEFGCMYPIAEKYIDDEARIRELCALMNGIRAPRERKEYDDRYLLLGGGENIFLFVEKDGTETMINIDGQTPVAHVRRPGMEKAVSYSFGYERIEELERIFREEIETSFWYQE